jgi:4'-phosphopantetheinyl transferase
MDALHLQMKLTPQLWTWDGAHPSAEWPSEHPSDVPVVWQAHLTDDAAIQSHLVSLLSVEERDRLQRLRLREDQQRFLAGRGLVRILVGAQLNLPPERVELEYGPFGKPRVVSPTRVLPLHFNVAHSGKLVLLAMSLTHEVGVDVEEMRPDQNWEDVAQRIFSTEEHRNWLRLNPDERFTAFFQIWTRHEAGLKALGQGLSGEIDSSLNARLTFFDLELPQGYQGAVACLC